MSELVEVAGRFPPTSPLSRGSNFLARRARRAAMLLQRRHHLGVRAPLAVLFPTMKLDLTQTPWASPRACSHRRIRTTEPAQLQAALAHLLVRSLDSSFVPLLSLLQFSYYLLPCLLHLCRPQQTIELNDNSLLMLR